MLVKISIEELFGREAKLERGGRGEDFKHIVKTINVEKDVVLYMLLSKSSMALDAKLSAYSTIHLVCAES